MSRVHKRHRFWISTKNWTFWHNEIWINLSLYFSHKIQLYLFRKNKNIHILLFENVQFLMLLIQSLSHVWTSKSLFESYSSWNLRWVGLVVLIFVFFFSVVYFWSVSRKRWKKRFGLFAPYYPSKEKISFIDLLHFNRIFYSFYFIGVTTLFYSFYGIGVMIPFSDFFIKPNKKKLVGVLLPKNKYFFLYRWYDTRKKWQK